MKTYPWLLLAYQLSIKYNALLSFLKECNEDLPPYLAQYLTLKMVDLIDDRSCHMYLSDHVSKQIYHLSEEYEYFVSSPSQICFQLNSMKQSPYPPYLSLPFLISKKRLWICHESTWLFFLCCQKESALCLPIFLHLRRSVREVWCHQYLVCRLLIGISRHLCYLVCRWYFW